MSFCDLWIAITAKEKQLIVSCPYKQHSGNFQGQFQG